MNDKVLKIWNKANQRSRKNRSGRTNNAVINSRYQKQQK